VVNRILGRYWLIAEGFRTDSPINALKGYTPPPGYRFLLVKFRMVPRHGLSGDMSFYFHGRYQTDDGMASLHGWSAGSLGDLPLVDTTRLNSDRGTLWALFHLPEEVPPARVALDVHVVSPVERALSVPLDGS
jgi:hypothetical protein